MASDLSALLEKYSYNLGRESFLLGPPAAKSTSQLDPSIQWPPPKAAEHTVGRTSPRKRQCQRKRMCPKCNTRLATTRCLDCNSDMCDLCHRHRHMGGGNMGTHQCVCLRSWESMPQYDDLLWTTEEVIMKSHSQCKVCRRFVYKGREAIAKKGKCITLFFHPECYDTYFVDGNKFTREGATPGVPFTEGIRKTPDKFDVREEVRKAVAESFARSARERAADLRRPSCTKFGKDYMDKPAWKYRAPMNEEEEDNLFSVL